MRRITLPIIVILLAAGLPVVPVMAYQVPEVAIISPGTSAIISGTVPIHGTVVDSDFRHYELEFAPDPAVGDVWYPIQPPVAQQVREGVLGSWDTTLIEDGRYLIRLRVVRNDGSELSDQVRVIVANATPTPIPTITLTPTITPTLDFMVTETGATATPMIWQPPTRTPDPNAVAAPPTATPRTIDLTGDPLQTARLGEAAGKGVRFTLIVFGLLAIYGIARTIIRGGIRRAWWEFRREVISPIIDSITRRPE